MSEQDEELKQIDDYIELIHLERKTAIDRWLAACCPLKKGDIVTACGYTHKGKQMRVDALGAKQDWLTKDYIWFARGTVLKANGEPGQQTAEFDQKQYERELEGTR